MFLACNMLQKYGSGTSQQDKISAVNFIPQTMDTFKFKLDVTCLLLYLTFISGGGVTGNKAAKTVTAKWESALQHLQTKYHWIFF